ncbi:hypothetical protein B7C42_00968 [Nocardia cerradoensis]|uniref:Uncharacterized protein n=1 Tax=Nocardia cerradoensis TaxID=85688 RepID=A0A231HFT4_9NOCA|nr:hypothetical protein B7C42_00968 [Nocardia cerradoensis]
MFKTLIAFAAGGAAVAGAPAAWRFLARHSNTQVHQVRR